MGIGKNKALLLFAVFSLVLLSGCTYTDSSGNEQPVKVCASGEASEGIQVLWSSWQGVLFTAVNITFLFAAAVYALSGVVNHRGLRVWARNQFYEGIVTLFMAFFFIGFVSFLCGLDVVPLLGLKGSIGSANIWDASEQLLEEFTDNLWKGFGLTVTVYIIVAALGTFTYAVNTSGLGAFISLGSAFSQMTQGIPMALTAIMGGIVLMKAQILILKLAEKLFVFLMPTGILLRGFGATRGLGGALMALAIGFYLMYPFAIVLMYSTISEDYNPEALQGDVSEFDVGFSSMRSGGGWISDLYEKIVGHDSVFETLGICVVGTVIIPGMTFIMLTSFVKGLSRTLGEEIDVSNLTRMI